jgi:vancomycin resistance protein VanW
MRCFQHKYCPVKIQRLLPFPLRAGLRRLQRRAHWLICPKPWANQRSSADNFPQIAVARESPLQRSDTGGLAAHTTEKTRNLELACARINGLIVGPGEVFSFCRTVGPTTRRRGYLPALEMHDGSMGACVGGGLCQLANLLFALAVAANAEILERHRHSLDLFPDTGRDVPFGFGATVFYNYVDFQFRNRLPFPLMLETNVRHPVLAGAIRTPQNPTWRVRVIETDHAFYRRDGAVWRRNKVWREVTEASGAETRELLLANDCRVLYPADHLVTES